MKANKNLPTTKALCVYRLVDKQTGITVVADDEKDTLIKKYEGLKGQYEVFRKSNFLVTQVEFIYKLCQIILDKEI